MKRILAAVILFVTMLPCEGRRYPFVRVEKNELQFPGGKSADYELFLRKLDSLVTFGSADVRILHVGGSHVQGGTWTDRLRRSFLALRYGMDGGRGLVFPFATAGTNTPVSYTTTSTGNWETTRCLRPERTVGLTGMGATAVDTSARTAIDLLPRENRIMTQHYCFNRVTLLGYGEREPVLLLSKKDTLWGRPEGDLWRFDLPAYTDWIQIGVSQTGTGSYTLEGAYLDKSRKGFTLSEAGVNGAATSSWLKCGHWERNLRVVKPDLVIFSVGINDIQGPEFSIERFKSNYRELIKMVRRVNPRCALLFTGINDSSYRNDVNPHTRAVEDAMEELAKEYKGVFWDMYEIMGGYGSMAVWREAGLAQSDLVHFTPDGYRLLGDLLFDAIMASAR
ncbi:MAG: hypothetical protein J5835_04870 [Bacteroidales bacterium]|nr:hypothetical protein [Bacteroidales bacterium]